MCYRSGNIVKPLGKKASPPPRRKEDSGSPLVATANVELFNHELPEEPDPRLLLLNEPDSDRAAAFRVLRHKVTQGDAKSILVTSPRISEGKTLVAVNLALALTETGAKVLLLETNLRSPQLAHVFGFTPPWCFAAQLATHRDQPLSPWRLVEVSPSGLHLGALDPMVDHERFDATGFSTAIEHFTASDYDYILVDCPAVLGAAEVNLMQDAADSILFTGIAGRVTARALRQSTEQLAPANILGFAMVEGSSLG